MHRLACYTSRLNFIVSKKSYCMSIRPSGENIIQDSDRYVPQNSGKSYGFSQRNVSSGSNFDKSSLPPSMKLQRPRMFCSDSEPILKNGSYMRRNYSSIPPRNESFEKELFQNTSSGGINFDKYDDIPVNVDGDDIQPMSSFSDVEFGSVLDTNIKLSGFEKPTPIQKFSIPIIMKKRDLMACAQTGSGKTAAFLVPIIKELFDYKTNSPEQYFSKGQRNPLCVILAPTRELVQQIYRDSLRITYRTRIEPVAVYGGERIYEQVKKIARGCDIIVATPGRLIDILIRQELNFNSVRYLVLDEADRMLDMGFEPQIRKVFEISGIPDVDKRQTVMFSATFPKEIQKLASDLMKKYVFLTIGRVGSVSQNIKQEIIEVPSHEKFQYLLKVLNEIQDPKMRCLIFVEKKRDADIIEMDLFSHGLRVVSIHGDRTQPQRDEALSLFKSGSANVMVATDVAQRGLDISNVTHVINYHIGNDLEDYVHRIGRTGRAGNVGTAITFFTHENYQIASGLITLLKDSDQEIPEFLYSCRSNRSSGSSWNYNRKPNKFTRYNSTDSFRKNAGKDYWGE